jgi:plasmid maintenance system antidote protein VapI
MDLKKYIETEGLKLRPFAEKVGITHSTLQRLLTKKYDMTLSVAYRIVKYTKRKVDFKDLIEESVGKKTRKHKISGKDRESNNNHEY